MIMYMYLDLLSSSHVGATNTGLSFTYCNVENKCNVIGDKYNNVCLYLFVQTQHCLQQRAGSVHDGTALPKFLPRYW